MDKEIELRKYFEVLNPKLKEDEKEKCEKIFKAIKEKYKKIYEHRQLVPAIIYIVNNQYTQFNLTFHFRRLITKKKTEKIGTSLTTITKIINQKVMKIEFPNIMSNFCTSDKMKRRVIINKLKIIIPKIPDLFEKILKKCNFISELQKELSRSYLKLILFFKRLYSSSLEVMYYHALFPYIIFVISLEELNYYTNYSEAQSYWIDYDENKVNLKRILSFGNIFNEECDKVQFLNAKKRLDHIFGKFYNFFRRYYSIDLSNKKYSISRSYSIKDFEEDKEFFNKMLIIEENKVIKSRRNLEKSYGCFI
jgi:hypothetical protein